MKKRYTRLRNRAFASRRSTVATYSGFLAFLLVLIVYEAKGVEAVFSIVYFCLFWTAFFMPLEIFGFKLEMKTSFTVRIVAVSSNIIYSTLIYGPLKGITYAAVAMLVTKLFVNFTNYKVLIAVGLAEKDNKKLFIKTLIATTAGFLAGLTIYESSLELFLNFCRPLISFLEVYL